MPKANWKHRSVCFLLEKVLKAQRTSEPVISACVEICLQAGGLVERSDASPAAWAAAFVYLGFARRGREAMRQEDAAYLFNVSNATVSVRTREIKQHLGW